MNRLSKWVLDVIAGEDITLQMLGSETFVVQFLGGDSIEKITPNMNDCRGYIFGSDNE